MQPPIEKDQAIISHFTMSQEMSGVNRQAWIGYHQPRLNDGHETGSWSELLMRDQPCASEERNLGWAMPPRRLLSR
ncbi:MAG TPA: hypothetical protein PKN13_06330 [Accumulibacter sp.]|nr:hypothetical protein [Accumulibacter sp.]HMW17418.1 hypothetical protein [Accumulibacter sp.]HMX22020.1 hypothetical protein [Accumulibacter sp.]HMY06603.1 hypothetical protein [Accumulibacter sp.]HNC17811.1 hypothetical protein [Accumulibacter sp.]